MVLGWRAGRQGEDKIFYDCERVQTFAISKVPTVPGTECLECCIFESSLAVASGYIYKIRKTPTVIGIVHVPVFNDYPFEIFRSRQENISWEC